MTEPRPTFPKARAGVGAFLFVAWLGFLGFLVWQTRDPVLLSRPQILAADLIVVAELVEEEHRPANRIQIKEVLYASDDAGRKLAGQPLEVDDLFFCSAKQGWQGPGTYIVPISRDAKKSWTTMLPISPGYYPAASEVTLNMPEKGRDSVLKLLADLTGLSEAKLKSRLNESTLILRNVAIRTLDEKDAFARQVADFGGVVERTRGGESRIYRATAAAIDEARRIRK